MKVTKFNDAIMSEHLNIHLNLGSLSFIQLQ